MATVSVRFWSSFSKRKNSTKQPGASPTRTHDCYLKEDCSIEEPIFCLKIDSGVDPSAYTYCQAFGNYYYITTREYSPPHWNLYCNLDAMATFKSAIGASSLYVLRSYSGFWNDRLVDSVPVMCDPIDSKQTRDGDSNYPFPKYNPGCYVVTIPSADSVSGVVDGVSHYVLSDSGYKNFLKSFFSLDWNSNATGTPLNLQDDVKALINPINYITDIRWYPLEPSDLVPRGTPLSHVVINGWDTLAEGYGTSSLNAVYSESTFQLQKHDQSGTLGRYLNTSSFTKYSYHDPLIGTFNIDANSITNCTSIQVEYYIDASCGQGMYYIYAKGSTSGSGYNEVLINSGTMDFGVSVVFSQRVKGALVAAVENFSINSPQKAITEFAKAEIAPKLTTIGSVACRNAYFQVPYLYTQFSEIVPINRSLVGYPCCQTVQLSTIPGFIQCQTGDINVSCAPEYKAEIKAYLEGGFFYE